MASSSEFDSSEKLSSLLLRPSTAETDVPYFDKLCEGINRQVAVRRHPCPSKGRGLFAASAISAGDIVLEEYPLFSQQDLDNRTETLVCSHCMRHAGGVVDQLQWYLLNKPEISELEQRLLKSIQHDAVQLPDICSPQNTSKVTYCRCGTVYCSEKCRKEAYEAYHCHLCTETTAGDNETMHCSEHCAQPMETFTDFCDESNPGFYLAAKALSQCLTRLDKFQTTNSDTPAERAMEEAWKPFWHAWRPMWWECIPPPNDVNDAITFKEELLDLIRRASEHLTTAITSPAAKAFFSPEVMGSVMGLIEQNNIAISIPSSLERYIDFLNEAEDALVQSLWERYPRLKETLIEAAQYSAEGSGYYCIACCANHSCIPNARSLKRDGVDVDHQLILVATTNISAGEEITISYIDETGNKEERTNALGDYGFSCDCPKCLSGD